MGFPHRITHSLSRRMLLQVGASSLLGLPSLWSANPTTTAPKAKAVLLLWLWGGPAQLDTWDPKPNAPLEFRGPFASIPTKVAGLRFGELFPKIAGLADRFAVLRSLKTFSNDHGVAGTAGLTGSAAGGVGLNGKPLAGKVRPAMGSVVARARSSASGLPPFLVVGGRLHQGKKTIVGEGGGKLGGRYDPFRIEYDPVGAFRVPALHLLPDLTPERLTDRRQLLDSLSVSQRSLERQADATRNLQDYRQLAFEMLTSSRSLELFDLSKEPQQLRDRYGRTRFGQSCLLGRRLIEQGVPFVQVNWSDHVEAEEDAGDGGWDHHYRNFQLMQNRHGPWLDRAYSALLEDLSQRGLLESTLVLAVGEFGRTPKINNKSGRDHWQHCYSALVAGGGVQGGRIYGTSDAKAEHPIDRASSPGDLIATVQHAVGISSEQAQTLGLAPPGEVLHELF